METTGTNCNAAISALKQTIPNLSKISDQRKKRMQQQQHLMGRQAYLRPSRTPSIVMILMYQNLRVLSKSYCRISGIFF
eukprot:5734059-Ditylum_brightwellii.AAC.1